MLHIELKGMTNAATCKHIFCPYTHPRSLGWDQRSKHFFSESSHGAYQIYGMEHRAPCKHTVYSYFMPVCSSLVTYEIAKNRQLLRI